jgi:hypothetical protein
MSTNEAALPMSDNRPWYRHVWPWLLMIPPLASVVGGVTTLTLAIRTPDALVVDDYSTIGKYTQQKLERSKLAAELGLVGEGAIEAPLETGGAQSLALTIANVPYPPPPRLTLAFSHPTRAGLDKLTVLTWDGARYRGLVEGLPDSRYYLQVEPPAGDWRLVGEIRGNPSPIRLEPGLPGD